MCQILEDIEGEAMEIGEEWDMLMEKLKDFKIVLMKREGKYRK